MRLLHRVFIMLSFISFSFLLLIWGVLWAKICFGIFRKMDKFKSFPLEVSQNEELKAFLRSDAKYFNKWLFYVKGFFRVPFTFPLIIIYHILGIVYINLICFLFPLEKEGINNYPKVHMSLILV